ncbi:hypothetical protein ACE1TF_15450 [Geomicrobium sp. JSM 1781026]|uniref:hypothetical protein n=1 Tax=Geomicrobium sp. JSM 1781026 TaxID=3344580 RepID=UPI0035BFC236
MKVDALYMDGGKAITFRTGELNVTENDQWNGVFHAVDEQNLIFDAVSSKKTFDFKFETSEGTFEGPAFVSDIDSEKTENIVYIQSTGNLKQK